MTGPLAVGEIRVVVRQRGTTDGGDRALLEQLARRASGFPGLTLLRRCSRCGGTDHGAPMVRGSLEGVGAGLGVGFSVSLSRASDTVAFALSMSPVGIDIESMAALARRDVERVAFTAAERERMASSPNPERLRAELWAGKEAVLKLRGTGLRVEPGSFELTDVVEALHPFDAGSGLVGMVAGLGTLRLLGEHMG